MPVENRGTAKRPRWRYAFTIRGVRYRASIPEARTKYEAEQAETEAKKEVFEGRYGRPSGECAFAKFIGDPDAEGFEFEEGTFLAWAKENKKSWRNDVSRAKALLQQFRGKTFAQISPLSIEKFKSDRRRSTVEFKHRPARDRSLASVNRELELLSRIFTRAIELKLTANNPCDQVRRFELSNKRHRYLLDEEEPRLLVECEGTLAHLRRLIVVAIRTGMRRGDQLNLRKSQVDFQRDVIWVPNAKTGKEYPVPMSPELREIMLGLVRETPASEYVFANPATGKPYVDLKKGFAEACSKAGITDLHWHDLRHTFGTRLAEAGYSEATIAELMGHADRKTTGRYTHGTDRAKREAVEAAAPRAGNARPNYAPEAKQPPKLAAVKR
jgi:integrase